MEELLLGLWMNTFCCVNLILGKTNVQFCETRLTVCVELSQWAAGFSLIQHSPDRYMIGNPPLQLASEQVWFPKYIVTTRPTIAQMRWRGREEREEKNEGGGGGLSHRNVVVFASFVWGGNMGQVLDDLLRVFRLASPWLASEKNAVDSIEMHTGQKSQKSAFHATFSK